METYVPTECLPVEQVLWITFRVHVISTYVPLEFFLPAVAVGGELMRWESHESADDLTVAARSKA
jgi:hypothetical protein